MKNNMRRNSIFLLVALLAAFSSRVHSFSLEGEQAEAKVSSTNSYLRATLTTRTREGKLVTSAGDYQITAGVKVDDRRPIDSWFKNPADANISLELESGRVVGVVIY